MHRPGPSTLCLIKRDIEQRVFSVELGSSFRPTNPNVPAPAKKSLLGELTTICDSARCPLLRAQPIVDKSVADILAALPEFVQPNEGFMVAAA